MGRLEGRASGRADREGGGRCVMVRVGGERWAQRAGGERGSRWAGHAGREMGRGEGVRAGRDGVGGKSVGRRGGCI